VLGHDFQEVEQREDAEAADFEQAAVGPGSLWVTGFIAVQGIASSHLQLIAVFPNQNVGRWRSAYEECSGQGLYARGMYMEAGKNRETLDESRSLFFAVNGPRRSLG